MERLIEEAVQAIGHRDWESLRLLLHPYVQWKDGGRSIRGRTKVLAASQGPSDRSASPFMEVRDGQIYRWVL